MTRVHLPVKRPCEDLHTGFGHGVCDCAENLLQYIITWGDMEVKIAGPPNVYNPVNPLFV